MFVFLSAGEDEPGRDDMACINHLCYTLICRHQDALLTKAQQYSRGRTRVELLAGLAIIVNLIDSPPQLSIVPVSSLPNLAGTGLQATLAERAADPAELAVLIQYAYGDNAELANGMMYARVAPCPFPVEMLDALEPLMAYMFQKRRSPLVKRAACEDAEGNVLPAKRDRHDQILDHLEFEKPTDWLLPPLKRPGDRLRIMYRKIDEVIHRAWKEDGTFTVRYPNAKSNPPC